MKIRNPKVNQYSFLDNLIGEGQVWIPGKFGLLVLGFDVKKSL